MKRDFATVVFPENEQMGFAPGDEAAHRAAAALADRCDAPTIIALTDAMAFLERVGGQFHLITLREKVDLDGRVASEDEPGDWRTIALKLSYETRDGRITAARPPQEILGIEATDFNEAPTRIEIDAPEPESVEDEGDLRDEIEAEVAAEPEPEPAAVE